MFCGIVSPGVNPQVHISTLQLSPQDSKNGDHRSHSANGSSSVSTVAVPTRVHQITQHYMSHVHNLVQCHELWEQAENQAAEFPGKLFQYILLTFYLLLPWCSSGSPLDFLIAGSFKVSRLLSGRWLEKAYQAQSRNTGVVIKYSFFVFTMPDFLLLLLFLIFIKNSQFIPF